MALDKLIDSARLERALHSTAYFVGALMAYIADEQAIPTFGWDMDDGFAPDFYAYTLQHAGGDASGAPFLPYAANVGSVFSRAKAGTFTLAANQSSGYTVTHDLGVLPDLIVFWTDDGTVSDPAAISGQLQNAGMCWTRKRAGSPKGHMGYRMRSSSGALAAADNAFSTITDTTFRISAASNNLLPGGVTFFWMAAALKGGE